MTFVSRFGIKSVSIKFVRQSKCVDYLQARDFKASMLFKVFKVIVIEQEFFSLVASNFFSSDVFSDNIKEDLEFFYC